MISVDIRSGFFMLRLAVIGVFSARLGRRVRLADHANQIKLCG